MNQWQLELKNSITSYQELFKLLNLNNLYHPRLAFTANCKFPLFVTRSFVNRIIANNINDPLLLQILPTHHEDIIAPNYLQDPLQEQFFNKMPGLIHKYFGRVLILSTKKCAINCRYCFRRHFPFNSNIASGHNLINIVNYIKNDISIEEVILSGGDPLLAPNNYFKKLLALLNPISHLETIRIHSRIPIVLPARLEQELIEILLNSRFNIVIVTHSNHPNEINEEVANFFKIFHGTKILLLNQSVLLKNINDNPDLLATLSKKLFKNLKVLPYYLHMLDRVNGASHFAVDINTAKNIWEQLAAKLPGYLLPKLTIETPGNLYKNIIV